MQQPDKEKVDLPAPDTSVRISEEDSNSASSVKNIAHNVDRPSSPALSTTSSTSQSSKLSQATLIAEQKKVYSAGANTFFALQHNYRTLPEFSVNPFSFKSEQKAQYKAAKFVALELIALWVPRAEDDLHNHTLHYFYKHYDDSMVISPYYLNIDILHYTKFPPGYVRNKFQMREALHLGSLLFLNLLLDGELTDRNLCMGYSSSCESYFVQQSTRAVFFKRFLRGKDPTIDKFNIMSFLDSSKHIEWWSEVIPDSVRETQQTAEYLRGIFLQEIFETVLRICLTPDNIVQLIVDKLLDPTFAYADFIIHITSIKNNVLDLFLGELTPAELTQWDKFLQENAGRVYQTFRQDLHFCMTNFSTPGSTGIYRSSMFNLEARAHRLMGDSLSSIIRQPKSLEHISKYVGLELIGIWMPRENDDCNNKTFHYIYDEPSDSIVINSRYQHLTAQHYVRYDSNLMRQNYDEGNPMHLGSLLFLNYLLDGALTDKNLGISSGSDGDYFVQSVKGSAFFRRFIRGEAATLGEFDLLSFFDSSDYSYWWDSVIPKNITQNQEGKDYFRKIFLGEVFETVLRIHFTPDRVIELIVAKVSGFTNTYHDLIEHIKEIKNKILSNFMTFLADGEHEEWEQFFQQHSLSIYDLYRQDLQLCLNNFGLQKSDGIYSNALLDLIVNADKCKVPNLAVTLGLNRRGYNYKTPQQRAHEVAYFLDLIADNFELYGRFKDYNIWHYLDKLCSGLHSDLTRAKLFIEDDDDEDSNRSALQSILMAACHFEFNNICRFLLLQYPFLANGLISEDIASIAPYQIYKGVPMIVYATNIGNTTVADFIDLAMERKLSDEDQSVQRQIQYTRVKKGLSKKPSMDFGHFQGAKYGKKPSQLLESKSPQARKVKNSRSRSSSFSGWEELAKQSANATSARGDVPSFELSFEQFKEFVLPPVASGKKVEGDKKATSSESASSNSQIFFPPLATSVGDGRSFEDGKEQYKESSDDASITYPYGGYGSK